MVSLDLPSLVRNCILVLFEAREGSLACDFKVFGPRRFFRLRGLPGWHRLRLRFPINALFFLRGFRWWRLGLLGAIPFPHHWVAQDKDGMLLGSGSNDW